MLFQKERHGGEKWMGELVQRRQESEEVKMEMNIQKGEITERISTAEEKKEKGFKYKIKNKQIRTYAIHIIKGLKKIRK